MSPPAPPQLDALVIGAGWAGLQCALRLAQAGKQVVCLEARKRLGGRAFTHTWDENTPMDNNERQAGSGDGQVYSVDFGCSYIHGYLEGNPVKEIAEKYGVRAHIPKATPSRIIGPHDPLSDALAKRLQSNLGAAQDSVKQAGKQKRSQASNEARGLGNTSLASSILATDSPLFKDLTSEAERKMAVGLARSLHVPLGTELEHVAADFYGVENNFAGTDAMPEGGFSNLIAKVAEDVQKAGGQIRLGEVVTRVVGPQQQQSQGVCVVAQSEDGSKESRYDAKTAIVTMPLAVLKKQVSIFEPALAKEQQDAIARTTVGNLNKVLLTYEKPWWDETIGTFQVLPSRAPLQGSPASLEELYASSSLIVSSLCAPNGLPNSLTSPSLLVMIGGEAARHLEKFDRLQAAESLHAYLFSRLKHADASLSLPQIKHAFYSRWTKQAFTGGATTTPTTLNNSPADFATLAQPAWNGSLYFAGEHCQPDHRGSIAGAVVSADEAASAVLRHLQQHASRY